MRPKNLKKCVVCGREFPCPPSTNRITCSKECMTIRKQQAHKGKSNVWTKDSKDKLKQRGQTGNLKKGTAAAQASPKSGHYETNVSAKHWCIKSPDNVLYEFDNLSLWMDSHPEWFANVPSGSSALSRTGHYKGWYVISRSPRKGSKRK